MSEWKELKIDNLPPDILTGNYEFKWKHRIISVDMNSAKRYDDISERIPLLKQLKHKIEDVIFYYRKPEPKKPSHEYIAKEYAIKNYPYPVNMVSGIGIDITIDGFRKIAEKAFIAGIASTVRKQNE